MKKVILLSVLSLSVLFGFGQNWQATNLTNVTYLAISELEPHNNDLYSIVFSGFASTMYRLDPSQTSWTQLTPTGITGTPSYMKSTGSTVYLGTIGLLESNLYFSTDGVNYSLADTAGLPQETGGFARMYGLEYFNGRLVLNLGSSGYWIKEDGQSSWSYINTPTALNAGVDPLVHYNGKLFAVDQSGNNEFYTSSNYGSTWTTFTATGLPNDFTINILFADQATGRLYADGGWNSTEYGLFYSDDDGANWTQIDISAFITTDYNGGMQTITAFYAKGSTIYFCLENDENMSHPNVVGTTSGTANFAMDTVGLPPAAAGTVNALHFAEFQGQLAMSLNVIDAYLKGVGTGIEETVSDREINLFPNPVKDILNVNYSNNVTINTYDIIDIKGQVIASNTLINKHININGLSKGIYCIRLYAGNKLVGTQKFIKE